MKRKTAKFIFMAGLLMLGLGTFYRDRGEAVVGCSMIGGGAVLLVFTLLWQIRGLLVTYAQLRDWIKAILKKRADRKRAT